MPKTSRTPSSAVGCRACSSVIGLASWCGSGAARGASHRCGPAPSAARCNAGRNCSALSCRQAHHRRLHRHAQVGRAARRGRWHRARPRTAGRAGTPRRSQRVAVARARARARLPARPGSVTVLGGVLLQRRIAPAGGVRCAGVICAQEHLAAGRAMRRHARARVQVEAQRRGGFHAVEVDHFAARQRGDVAAFADLFRPGWRSTAWRAPWRLSLSSRFSARRRRRTPVP